MTSSGNREDQPTLLELLMQYQFSAEFIFFGRAPDPTPETLSLLIVLLHATTTSTGYGMHLLIFTLAGILLATKSADQ